MKKENLSLLLSIISSVISIISICIAAYRSPELGFDYMGIIVGILSLLVTILIGWQIYNFIYSREEINKAIKNIITEYLNQFYHAINGKIIARLATVVSHVHDVRTFHNCFIALDELLKSENIDTNNYILNYIIAELKLGMKQLKDKHDGELVIWEGKKKYYIDVLNRIDHEDKFEIIDAISNAKEIKSSW